MHFLIGLAMFMGLIAFAFGETAARGFAQGLFILLGLAVLLIAWDVYRDMPITKTTIKIEERIKPSQYNPQQL